MQLTYMNAFIKRQRTLSKQYLIILYEVHFDSLLSVREHNQSNMQFS